MELPVPLSTATATTWTADGSNYNATINCASGQSDSITAVRDAIGVLLTKIDAVGGSDAGHWGNAASSDNGSNKVTELTAAAGGTAFNFSGLNAGVSSSLPNSVIEVTKTDGTNATSAQKVRIALPGSVIEVAEALSNLGQEVYLSASAGECTQSVPGSGSVIRLGYCVKSGSAGNAEILFLPQVICDL